VRTVSILVAALLPLAACADAGPAEAQQQPSTRLTVTFRADDRTPPTVWELTCDPAGGDHPEPQAACQALVDAGDPFAPPPKDQICTEIYGGPERATVEGAWRSERVRADFSRTNGCEIARWDALRAVLQP
jgi:hypothetical protein